jgi:UDP-N-acetylglucosamine diphosphorylase/glucosamine-1-phosphate N-acetyltransferase
MTIFDLPRMADQSRLVESLWDLIYWNEESLIEDATHLESTTRDGAAPSKPAGPYHMVRDDDVWLVGKEAKLSPGCVLDATNGPVVIGEGASIGANAVIEGPVYIAPYAVIKPLSHIRPGTSIGTACRVGGEVCESVILDYSNKSHDGFMGHSYVGKWVNLGAGTTTSNLKNTYGEITIQRGGKEIATGRRFLGALVGDHTKTGVLTRLGAGTYVGFCSSLAGRGTAPRFVPSYSFWTEEGMQPYDMAKAVEVTQRVYARRDREFTQTDRRVMEYVARVAPEVEG